MLAQWLVFSNVPDNKTLALFRNMDCFTSLSCRLETRRSRLWWWFIKMVMNTQTLRGKRLQLALAFTGAIAWILQGYDQALMNGTSNDWTVLRDAPRL